MKYSKIREAVFVKRPNRFTAVVLIDGIEETVHVNNTGRCEELLIPGCTVILSESDNEKRKTKYDLVAVYRGDYGVINIDSLAPNAVIKEWLQAGNDLFPGIDYLKPECDYDKSRFDFYLEKDDRKIFIEAKGCTLVRYGTGYFPDAPTERGTKHLRELTEAVADGYECYIAFVIQVNGIDVVLPNKETDPDFRDALVDAIKGGVKLLFIKCNVTPDEIKVRDTHLITHL